VNFTKGNQANEAEIGIATSIAAGFNSNNVIILFFFMLFLIYVVKKKCHNSVTTLPLIFSTNL
jgi:hypothetical protein